MVVQQYRRVDECVIDGMLLTSEFEEACMRILLYTCNLQNYEVEIFGPKNNT